MNTTLNSTNITDFENLGLTDFPRDKYIYIDNNKSDNNSICLQYLLGKSKIVNIINYGEGVTDNTEIIIGGGSNACQLIGI